MKIEVSYPDEKGDDIVLYLPAQYEVCSTCKGHGHHKTSSDDDIEATCYQCNGCRVIKVVDEGLCTPEESVHLAQYRKYKGNNPNEQGCSSPDY